MAWLLVGLAAVLALIRPVVAHNFQELLKSKAGILGGDEAWSNKLTQNLQVFHVKVQRWACTHLWPAKFTKCSHRNPWWGWVPARGCRAEVGCSWRLWLCWLSVEICSSFAVGFWSATQCASSCDRMCERSCHSEGRGKDVRLRTRSAKVVTLHKNPQTNSSY